VNIFMQISLKIGSYVYLCTHNYADMVKLVDMPDLGSGAARRVGSSPIIRTKKASQPRSFFFGLLIGVEKKLLSFLERQQFF
jgi:hypothetical protein